MKRIARIAAFVAGLLLYSGQVAAGDQTYRAEIEKWRQDFDADVRTGGWLTLIGRVKIDEGTWTLGSEPSSAILLPSQLPTHLGVLNRHEKTIRFEPAGEAAVTIDGKPSMTAEELSTKAGTGKILSGGIHLHVRFVGDDPYLFIIDPNKDVSVFKGNSWYAIDTAYRISAKFEPYSRPQQVPVPMTHVTSREAMSSTGDVVFQLEGRKVRLQTFVDEDQLFVMFLDPTNGNGTYGGGRFLHAPLPRNGATVLDFNKAFNPYCSLNPNVMCPVPPPGNRLRSKVTAGEKFVAQE